MPGKHKATISPTILIGAGYKNWNTDRYQKRFDDENGIKYFINCEVNRFPEQIGWWYTFHIQIETKNGAVELETVQWFNENGTWSGNTIEDVEKYFEWFWAANGKPYYKRK